MTTKNKSKAIFAIADVTSSSHLSRAGRVYATSTNPARLIAKLEELRTSTKCWLQIVIVSE
jgi:hypothetical protein